MDFFNSTTYWPLNTTGFGQNSSDVVVNTLPQFMDIVTVISRVIQSVLAMTFNSLTVAVIVLFRDLYSPQIIIFFSLAVADIIGGVSGFLVFTYTIFELPFPIWYTFCVLDRWLAVLSGGLNVSFVIYIAVDRWIYITFPLQYHNYVTVKTAKVTCLVIFFVILIKSVVLQLYGLIKDPNMPRECLSGLILTDNGTRQLYTVSTFMIMTLVTVCLYTRITCIAKGQFEKMMEQVSY